MSTPLSTATHPPTNDPPPGNTAPRPSSSSALQTRIITHMNADHTSSLILFLRHYNKVPPHLLATPKLTQITLDHLIIESGIGHSRYFTPIDPPMASLAEARARMVAMHQSALRGLNIPDPSTVITRYVAPQGFHLVVFIACALTYILFSTPWNFLPPTQRTHAYHRIVYAIFTLNHTFPQVARFLALIQPLLITAMVLIHGGEAAYFHFSRLRKYRFPSGLSAGKIYAQWLVSNFIEGVGAMQRFDEVVREMEQGEKKESGGKH